MGNQQTGSYSSSASNSTTNLAGIVRKSARSSRLRMAELLDLRRRSVGTAVDAIKREEASAHNNYRSFTYGQSPPRSFDGEQSSSEEQIIDGKSKSQQFGPPPRIEINGVQNEGKESSAEMENVEKPSENGDTILLPRKISDERRGSGCSLPSYSKHRAQKVDSRKIVARKRLERGQTTTNAPSNGGGIYTKNNTKCNRHPLMASLRASDLAQSLDTNIKCNMEICNEIKPLNVRSARSVSPLLHQQRRIFGSNGGSHRGSLFASSFSGDEGILSREQSDSIQKSWQLAKQRIKQFAGDDRCFGFFAFDRIFERAPELKPLFGISPNISLIDMDEHQMELHPFIRHIRIFTNILDLSVRNAAELETEMLPALFAYGQRHYRPKIIEQFNERTVRLFCSQIVGTICDLLDDELSPFAQEAWIEMVTYLGRALLSGFEHERQQSQGGKRFSLQKIH